MADTTSLFGLNHDIWVALSGTRLSQARIDQVAEALREMQRIQRMYMRDAGRTRKENHDLRIHLKDRDRYIRDLEAQLMPYLRAPQAETLSMLQEVMPQV